jgi:hypothetical protein
LAKQIVGNVSEVNSSNPALAREMEPFVAVQVRVARMLERAELGQCDETERESLSAELDRLELLTRDVYPVHDDDDADWWRNGPREE